MSVPTLKSGIVVTFCSFGMDGIQLRELLCESRKLTGSVIWQMKLSTMTHGVEHTVSKEPITP